MISRANITAKNRNAFTIIELLTAIAIIGILAAIAFGLTRGASERGNQARAEGELNLLSQYLEQYRSYYGDYPRVRRAVSNQNDGAAIIEVYNALNGMRGIPENSTLFTTANRQRAFIDRSKFAGAEFVNANPADPEVAEVRLLDPWGNPYRYYYDPAAASWENRSYVLYSMGPSGSHDAPSPEGFSDLNHVDNVDNRFANRR